MYKTSRMRSLLASSVAVLAIGLAGCSTEGGTRLGSVGVPGVSDAGGGGSSGGGSSGDTGGGGTGGFGSSTDGGGSGGTGANGGSAGSGSGSGGSNSGGSGSSNTGGGANSGGAGSGGSGTGGAGGGTGGTGGTGGSTGGTGGGNTASNGGGGTQTPTGLGAVLVTAGNAVLAVGDTAGGAVQPINNTLPATTPITGTIVQVDKSTGQALVDAGNGRELLVDGLRGAIGDAVAITALNTAVTQPKDGTSAVGLSALSDTQRAGTVATLGVAAGDKIATATVNGLQGLTLREVTPGALTQLAQLTAANTTLGGGAGAPIVGVSALSNMPASGQLAALTVLPTNGAGSIASANVPVVSQVLQGATSTGGLVGVAAGGTSVGGANPVVAVNVNSASPATGTLATLNVPVGGAIQPVAGALLPGVTAAANPSVNTPVANVVAPVTAAIAPVTGAVLPAVGLATAPTATSPVANVVAPVTAVVSPVTSAVLPTVTAATTPAATTPVANVVAPVTAVVSPVVSAVVAPVVTPATGPAAPATGVVGGLVGGLTGGLGLRR